MTTPDTAPGWDIFCRVIDNHGDLGVCWRLASNLAKRHQTVRLWVDDPSALAWMAPGAPPHGVTVHAFDAAETVQPADVVVEAFGCDPPAAFVHRMVERRPAAPLWINLEYLSAEPYVERCHGLPSPQHSGPGAGLTKWFFYPGFTCATGGLAPPRTPLQQAQSNTRGHSQQWFAQHGIQLRPEARIISLFCYDNPVAPDLFDAASHANGSVDLLLTPGPATAAANTWLRARGLASLDVSTRQVANISVDKVRLHALSYLPQPDYDALLRHCELNFVRGEDSLVSAIWAQRPFVWQIYPQHDDAHRVKLDAFLSRYLQDAPPDVREACLAAHAHWNRLALNDASKTAPRTPDLASGSPAALLATMTPAATDHAWRAALALAGQTDLIAELMFWATSGPRRQAISPSR